jgi:quinol-cytochrome oxidoreductase complex cytochrome b subunit
MRYKLNSLERVEVWNNLFLQLLRKALVIYPVPVNLSYLWNFGILAGFCLAIQLISGIILAMHYTPHVDLAFLSVEHIMRDVNGGWLLRYVHANGASMFFLVVYVHLFRGLYYGSYQAPRKAVWVSGVVILLLMILTAFMGYVLPWGQMSFWAATVITNLVSTIPILGNDILILLWGGYSVDNATLNRFFSLHYLLPFVILALVLVHIILLHENGSNNPLGIYSIKDKAPFTPYYTVKDIYGIVLFLFLMAFFVFFAPVYLGHPDNFIPANPLVTPTHIVPEWYFLPYYAILRSVPDKAGGITLLLLSIVMLVLLPQLSNCVVRSGYFRPFYKLFFWFFLVNCLILGWIGGKPIESPFYEIGQFSTIFYFGYFLFILPLISFFENSIILGFNKIDEIHESSITNPSMLKITNKLNILKKKWI